MSHDQGRPSLFAGMEDGADPGSDTQRVRILSTLESTRRSQRPARKGPSAKRGRQGPSRLLMVLMGLGAITLLAGFVMTVVNQKPPARLQAEHGLASVAPTAASAVAPAIAVAVAPAVAPESAASVASASDSSSPPATPAPEGAALTSTSSAAPAPRDPLAALATAALAAAPAPTPISASSAQAAAPSTSSPAKPRTQPARAATQAKAPRPTRNDRDVQLIEAVMSHASSRPAPAPTRP